MLSNFEIIPNTGYGDIRFGIDMDSFVEKYGEPEDIESFDKDVDINTSVLHYWKMGFSIFFEGKTDPVLSGIETEHAESVLFGEKIMGKSKDDIVALMKKNGYSKYEAEDDNYGDDDTEKELRISYDVSMMDFFFRDNKLILMNFGVLVDENGNVEKV